MATAGPVLAAPAPACVDHGPLWAPPPARFDGTAATPPKPTDPTPLKRDELVQALRDSAFHNALTDFAGLCGYRAADRALQAAALPIRAVFMGDSITEFWAIADPSLFARSATGAQFVDRGIVGQTTAQMLLRFRQDVIDLHPTEVHILGGTNDILNLNAATTLGSIEDNIRTMVELAEMHGIAIVLGAVPPMSAPAATPQTRAAVKALNTWLRIYAHREVVGFVDYNAALVDSHGALNPALSIDALHPNRAGFARMRQLATNALTQAAP